MAILRLKYRKVGYMKFLSHLDMVRLMERSFRRAQMPLEFSQGFNPRPKINFAAPLSVGVTSDAEVMEVVLTKKVDIAALLEHQREAFPAGIELVAGTFVDQVGQSSPKLMGSVSSCQYLISVINKDTYSKEVVETWLNDFMKQDAIMIEKVNKKKKVVQKDIKPAIRSFALVSVELEGHMVLSAHLDAGSESNLRAEDLMHALDGFPGVEMDLETLRLHRQKINAGDKDIYDL
ncbi:MAG: DUF2344 domain-containing protein [Clostridia bacterium]|nr:DUF2344 domain-containing protein [Clostridia bacterium]